MQRKQPAPNISLLAAVVILVMVATFLALVYDRLFGSNPTVSIMGLGAPPPTPTPLTADAEGAVQKMYDAMTNGVGKEYMKAISPSSREKIRPENLTRGLLERGKFEVYGYVLPLDFLTEVEYLDMNYSGELLTSDHVIVTSTGSIWIAAVSVQYPICDTWDVRPYSEGWLVDVDAPERSVRHQNIVAARLKDNPWLQSLPFGLGGFWDYLRSGPVEGVKKILNMCE